MGRPDNNAYIQEHNTELLRALGEEGLSDLPVIMEMDFGHTSPVFMLPYGMLAQIDCVARTFSLLERGVAA